MKINKIEISNPVILAPMAGVTNEAFRIICKNLGAGLVYSEMISDKGILYQNERTLRMINVQKEEHPFAIQIFGNSYETILAAAKLIVEHTDVDIIDVNMGCPVNKVIKSGCGSALLKKPDLVYDIVKSLKEHLSIPVTIKIRAGFDNNNINCDIVTKKACLAGVDAIAIHGRTRSCMYRGDVNLEYIKIVKENASCPVIGNGDITSSDKAIAMLEQTKVDGVMIGRASLGNPWIFKEITAAFKKMPYEKPSCDEILDMVLEHAKRLIVLHNEKIAIAQMRTHSAWYFKQLPIAKSYRLRLVKINTYQDLVNIVEEYRQNVFKKVD